MMQCPKGYWNGREWQFWWDAADCQLHDPTLPPVWDWNEAERKLISEKELHFYNCRQGNAEPVCCVWHWEKFVLYYRQSDCEIIDKSLPEVKKWTINYEWVERRKALEKTTIFSEIGLKKLNLTPTGTKPIACSWVENCDRYTYRKNNFIFLYRLGDCTIPYNERNIPECDYYKAGEVRDRENLYDRHQYRQLNLKPQEGSIPRYRYWAGDDWQFLYDRSCLEIDDPTLPPVIDGDSIPKHLYHEEDLLRLNRKKKANFLATACYWSYRNCDFVLLWNPEDCEIVDRTLATVYDQHNLPDYLSTAWGWEQKEPLFDLKPDPLIAGCIKDGSKVIDLYHRSQLVAHNREVFLSKSKLKQSYHLTNKLLALLGSPDRYKTQKINGYMVEAHLYSRRRIESFLNDRAEEYMTYLHKRGKTLALFSKRDNNLFDIERLKFNPEQYEAGKPVVNQFKWNKDKEVVWQQGVKCLRCASGMIMSDGFFCAVNPYGLDLNKLPCPDFLIK